MKKDRNLIKVSSVFFLNHIQIEKLHNKGKINDIQITSSASTTLKRTYASEILFHRN